VIFLYNLWIAVAAITAISALVAAIWFFKQRERLWWFVAMLPLAIFFNSARTALFLGMGNSLRAPNVVAIVTGLILHLFQAASVISLKLYLYGYFQRKRNSKDYPAEQ
jgi:hypothetical protein